MSRWIDADALRAKLMEYIGLTNGFDSAFNEAPSIDIVRCKECRYASDNKVYGCMLNHFNDNDYDYHRMYADDFCSYGERRSDGFDE